MDILTVEEVAELKGCSERYVRKLCRTGVIQAEEQIGQRGGANGVVYRIPLAVLDLKLQKKYNRKKAKQEAGLDSEPTEQPLDKVIPFNVELLTEEEREEVVLWRSILDNWMKFRDEAKLRHINKKVADEQYIAMLQLQYPEMQVSYRTLKRKWDNFKEHGDIALVDHRGKHGNHHKILSDFVYDIFEDYYLDESRKTITECMRLTEWYLKEAAPEYLPLPSKETFARALDRRTPVPVIQYFRFGQKAYRDKCAPYIKRMYDDLHSNDVWVTDNHTFDIMVNDSGKTVRVYLTGFLDVRSRKFVAWYVTENPSSQATVIALKRGIQRYGIPKMIYSDNGREFLTHDIGGKGFRERKSYKESDEHKPPTILDLLGIEFRTAIVRNAKAKIIERSFRTVKEQFSRLFEGYTGGHVLERPERLKGLAKDAENFTAVEDFRIYVDAWIDGVYNKEPHTGDGMYGKCPDEVYAANLIEMRTALPEELNLMMLRNGSIQKVKRNGVLLKFYDKELWYRTDDLCISHFDEKVYLRYDPDDLEHVRVYDLKDRFIGSADLQTPLSYHASTEEIKAHMQETRKMEKTVKAYKKQKDIQTRDALELTLDHAMENLESELELNPKVVTLHRFVDEVIGDDLQKAVGDVIDWDTANQNFAKAKMRKEGQ
ncbi:MAG: DDE-type integrase/transposase/recombinase [Lachnospiraceae bacterium]|nr:DDE-type integrase/transposase/recombinase [Lachnospiraceae bacterium]